MDWEANQEEIRKALTRIEEYANVMMYEDEIDDREDSLEHIKKDIMSILTKTENMTRWLKHFDTAEMCGNENEEEVEENGNLGPI